MNCKIILVDDHPIVRKGIVNLIANEPLFEIIADFDNGDFLLRHSLSSIPDVAVLDLSLPGMDGFSVAEKLRRRYPACKLVAYTAATSVLRRLQEAGFDAYVDKTEDPSQLIEAIRLVCEGRKRFPDEQRRIVSDNGSARPEFLTSREIEIIKLIAKGHTNKEISRQLFISDLTVKTHRRNINQKTGSKNVADLIQFLLRNSI